MTYKETFLQNLQKKYPLAETEDQLYECAIKSYHIEHEYAKKSRAESEAFAQNLGFYPEYAQLIGAFLNEQENGEIESAIDNIREEFLQPFITKLKEDVGACMIAIQHKVNEHIKSKLNETLDIQKFEFRCPSYYTPFDYIVSGIKWAGWGYDKLYPCLDETIRTIVAEEYDKLTDAEKLVLNYHEAKFIYGNLYFYPKTDVLISLYQSFGRMVEDSDTPTQPDSSHITELKGFAAVAGLQDLKEKLKSDIVDIIRNPERAKALKLSLPNGFLLYGPPGCGKTYFAKKLAEEIKCSFKYVDCADLSTPYIHGAQGSIGKLFDEAEEAAPCIVFLDEVDALIAKRENHHNVHTSGEVNVFLTRLNNCGKKGIIVIGATNRPLDIDPAALRSGRLENKYYFPLPDKGTRSSIFAIHLNGVALNGVIELDKLASLTEGFVSADIEKIVDDAKRIANRAGQDFLTMEMLEESIQNMKPSISKEQIKEYVAIRDKFEGRKTEYQRIGFC